MKRQPSRRALLFHTHIVLGETGNVARYRLKPIQAVFRCGELQDSAANSVYGDDLESIFPGGASEVEALVRGFYVIFLYYDPFKTIQRSH